jgi:hypothetical protein
MKSNLVLEANFVDVQAPVVAITNITAGMQVSDAAFTVMGMATDNVAVAGVFYSLNSGVWTLAAGTTNWSAALTLIAGTNTLAAYAVDSSGNISITNSASLDCILSTVLQVTTTSLPNGTTNVAYSQTLTASGGQSPYTWTVISGGLPAGLNLSKAGKLTGTPTINGTTNFTVRVTDSASSTATQALTLTIGSNSVPVRPVLNSVSYSSGKRFSIQLNGVAGQNYTLQMSTNLTSTNWLSILVTNAPSGSFFITDPNATNIGRYYRVMVGP